MENKGLKKRRNSFTLVELLVAMGVLILIFGFVLQFFVGSQKVWTSMAQRNRIYADARVAMDVMTTMLQNSFYSDGGIPFYIDRNSNTSGDEAHKIYFATKSRLNLPGDGDLKYVSFQRASTSGEQNPLMISIFCDEEKDNATYPFNYYFPPYGQGTVIDSSKASSDVRAKLNANLSSDDYGSVLIRHVMSFEIILYELDTSASGSGMSLVSSTTYSKQPYMVVLKLTLLSPADYKIWENISGTPQKSDFLTDHQYTFTRTVYLGNQPQMKIND